MEVIEASEADGDARTVRAAEGQVQLGRELPDHVFEIVPVDQDCFAAFELGVQHAAVFTSAEITQNRNMKRRIRLASFHPLAPFPGFDFYAGKRRWACHGSCNVIATGGGNRALRDEILKAGKIRFGRSHEPAKPGRIVTSWEQAWLWLRQRRVSRSSCSCSSCDAPSWQSSGSR